MAAGLRKIRVIAKWTDRQQAGNMWKAWKGEIGQLCQGLSNGTQVKITWYNWYIALYQTDTHQQYALYKPY